MVAGIGHHRGCRLDIVTVGAGIERLRRPGLEAGRAPLLRTGADLVPGEISLLSCCRPQKRLAALIGVAVYQHSDGLRDDQHVPPYRPTMQIFQIGLQAVDQVTPVIGGPAVATHLGEAG